jgi:hypothetical protein
MNREVWLRIPRSFDYEDEHKGPADDRLDPHELKYTINNSEPVLRERGYWDV